jgi:hypothetical protein
MNTDNQQVSAYTFLADGDVIAVGDEVIDERNNWHAVDPVFYGDVYDREGMKCIRRAALQQSDARHAGGEWYCEKCGASVPDVEVTYSEHHDGCGGRATVAPSGDAALREVVKEMRAVAGAAGMAGPFMVREWANKIERDALNTAPSDAGVHQADTQVITALLTEVHDELDPVKHEALRKRCYDAVAALVTDTSKDNRYQKALEQIANHPRNLTGAADMVRIAKEAIE